MKREQFTVYSTGSKLMMDDLKANPVLVAKTIAEHIMDLPFEDLERLFEIRLIDDEDLPGQTTIAVTITGRKSKNPKQGDEKIYFTSLNFL
jgi:hypothetical protein